MNRRMVGLAALLVIGAMLVVALAVAASLPADARLPTHWNIAGIPDGYSGKWTALLMPAAITLLVSALFHWLPALEPHRKGLERSQGLYLWTWMGCLLLFSVVEYAVVAAALRWDVDVARLIVGALGMLFAIIGNQLGKSRRMYLVGIRTPWTLASEDVWIRTHRLGGKLMTGAGLAILVLALVPVSTGARFTVGLALVTASSLVPIVYSWWLWRREQGKAGQPIE